MTALAEALNRAASNDPKLGKMIKEANEYGRAEDKRRAAEHAKRKAEVEKMKKRQDEFCNQEAKKKDLYKYQIVPEKYSSIFGVCFAENKDEVMKLLKKYYKGIDLTACNISKVTKLSGVIEVGVYYE